MTGRGGLGSSRRSQPHRPALLHGSAGLCTSWRLGLAMHGGKVLAIRPSARSISVAVSITPQALGIAPGSPPLSGHACPGVTSPCSLAVVRPGVISSPQHVPRTRPRCSSRAARICGSTARASWQPCKGPHAAPWAKGPGSGGDGALAAAEDGGSEPNRLLLSHFPLSQARGAQCGELQPSGEQ